VGITIRGGPIGTALKGEQMTLGRNVLTDADPNQESCDFSRGRMSIGWVSSSCPQHRRPNSWGHRISHIGPGSGYGQRGFAVVAEEVRKLAEQSQEATKQIAKLVGENHNHIEIANQAIKSGEADVKVGIEVANAANTAFAEVEKITALAIHQIQEISAAIQQIASGNQNLTASVEKIALISQETASQTETISAGTEEQLASIEEISSAANVLASMGENLHGHVARFSL
jgi:hypothetical protein